MRLASRPAPRRPARARALLAAAVALAVSGCGSHHNPSTTGSTSGADTAVPRVAPPTSCEEGDTACSCVDVDTADYDRACNVASDCTAVTTGRLCGASSCFSANAAINVDSYQLWNTDRQPVEYASCVPATAGAVACVSHACVIRYPRAGAAGSDGTGSGASGGSGGTEDGTDDGVYIDLTGDDDGTGTDTGTTPPAAGDDDDDSSGHGTTTGDDDDDDDDGKSETKRRAHADAVHARAALHAAPVTDTLKW